MEIMWANLYQVKYMKQITVKAKTDFTDIFKIGVWWEQLNIKLQTH